VRSKKTRVPKIVETLSKTNAETKEKIKEIKNKLYPPKTGNLKEKKNHLIKYHQHYRKKKECNRQKNI